MFGPRLTTVFASRWKAVWWAVSVLIFAWSVVPAADNKPEPVHVDPWAKDAPQP